jgi:hypothetical protein
MGARGKKPGAALGIVKSSITAITRPVPSKHLTTEQANTWRSVVDRLPADWFPRETHGVLEAYCRHVDAGRRIADLIESLLKNSDDLDYLIGEFDRLLRMQERESRAMSSLATRMRITQQSRINYKKSTGARIKPPWQSHIK